MTSPALILAFLLSVSFTLATQLGLWREESDHQKTEGGSVLQMIMGDSRRLFANHFLTKADMYLHSGVYPSIFDQPKKESKSHLAQATESGQPAAGQANENSPSESHEHVTADHEAEHDAASGFLGKPRDWIDAFGRNFFPTEHTHLDKTGNQREILPWLRFAAELNPNEVEIYPLAAYWLRQRMGKVKEAEDFLREGWRANPDSFEILFELGRVYDENHHDGFRARNLYELALSKWQKNESSKKQPDEFTFMQIIGHLERLEERDGHLERAIMYLETLRKLSPSPDAVQKQIDELKTKSAQTPHS